MSGKVRARVPAKINLYLGVDPLRADGYHELVTVYQAISLYDEVTLRGGPRRGPLGPLAVTISGEGADQLPLGRDNLAVRALELLAGATARETHGHRLHLDKQIPVAGGLAGGSADAAAALVAGDELWAAGLSRAKLAHLAGELGSDVPFLLHGGVCLGEGRGELIDPVSLDPPRTWHWVVVAVEGGLSTPAGYAELDRLRTIGAVPPPGDHRAAAGRLIAALGQGDPARLGAALHNDLQPAALSLRPELASTLAAGEAAGAVASLVSGSGPTCLFLAADAEHAAHLGRVLTRTPGHRRVLTAIGPVPGAQIMAGD